LVFTSSQEPSGLIAKPAISERRLLLQPSFFVIGLASDLSSSISQS
jgi:hypothetical protein